MTEATVSAILPLYNGARFVAGAIASVMAQTRAPCELIVVDDGSTDGSTAAATNLAASFPVRVVCQENRGQSAARNRGAAMASGDLLAFIDQDDEWHPEHLALLTAAVSEPGVGWAYSDFDEIDDRGAVVTRRFLAENDVGHEKNSITSCVSGDLMVLPSASVLRREAFGAAGGFDEELRGYEDDDLFVRLFRAGWEHRLVPRSLTRFRIHDVSCSTSPRFLASRLHYAGKLAALLPDNPRMSRYYLRDVIAPRFFFCTLDDYVRACSARDWAQARVALAVLQHFARLRPQSHGLRWKMLWVKNPRLFRWLIGVNDNLPGPLRWTSNPLIRLR